MADVLYRKNLDFTVITFPVTSLGELEEGLRQRAEAWADDFGFAKADIVDVKITQLSFSWQITAFVAGIEF